MNFLRTFLRNHGETLFYIALIVITTCVLGPSLDAYDQQQDAARTASR
jgi:hypothetical protein